MKKKTTTISTDRFDQIFDEGKDLSDHLDWDAAERPGLAQRRVNLDIPVWMIESLDSEAKRIGLTRRSIMKVWLAERIKQEIPV